MAKKRKNSNYIGSKGYVAKEVQKIAEAKAAKKRKIIIITSIILVIALLVATPFAIVGIVDSYKESRAAEEYENRTTTMGTGSAADSLMHRDLEGREIKYAEITIEGYGKLVVLLDATSAPKTVENFVRLASDGFYNGLTFHRANSYIIQGGDPKGNGMGGSEEKVEGEFPTGISHLKGVISMARSTDKNSASSQFFFCMKDCSSLTGSTGNTWDEDYAAFGYVVEGMSVIEAVNKDMVKLTTNETIKDKTQQPVIRSIKILTDYKFTHTH